MKKYMDVTQWVLGVMAALSLIVGVISKIVYVFSLTTFPNTSPMAFLWFTATCALASIALSLIKMCKLMDQGKK